MADEEQKLCDSCHERPGTNHISYGGHPGKGRSLCHVCLMQDSEVGGLVQRFNEAVRTGNCKYCGAPAETSFGGSSSALGMRFNLVCMTCYNDLVEFVRRPENAIPRGPFDDEAKKRLPQQMAERERREEEFMRQKILERKSKGNA